MAATTRLNPSSFFPIAAQSSCLGTHGQWRGLTAGWAFADGKRSLVCQRLYTSSSSSHSSHSSYDVETFDVRCGSSASITVDLYNSRLLNSPTRPLVLYFPRTGEHLRHTHPSIPSVLHSHPLAAINYRWNHLQSPPKPSHSINTAAFPNLSSSHPFPTPLHDTLNAYSWLTTQYLPSRSSTSSSTLRNAFPKPPPSPRARSRSPYAAEPFHSKISPRPLILYGSHLGATLATSLALTESRSSKDDPFPTAGLIALNGVFDWTSIATSLPFTSPSSLPTNQSTSQTKPWTLQTLHSLKTTLFTTPAYAFDAFASPVLFFRTPSVAIPRSPYFPGCEPLPSPPPASTDIESLTLSDAEYAALRSAEFDSLPSSTISDAEPQDEDQNPSTSAEAVRSSPVKFPPKDSRLRIPRSLFLSTSLAVVPEAGNRNGARDLRSSLEREDEFAAQAEEMARVMRRSVVMHEFKERVMWDEDVDPHAAAEERVRVEVLEGGEGEEDVVGEWLEGL